MIDGKSLRLSGGDGGKCFFNSKSEHETFGLVEVESQYSVVVSPDVPSTEALSPRETWLTVINWSLNDEPDSYHSLDIIDRLGAPKQRLTLLAGPTAVLSRRVGCYYYSGSARLISTYLGRERENRVPRTVWSKSEIRVPFRLCH